MIAPAAPTEDDVTIPAPPTEDDIAAWSAYLDSCPLPERTGEYERVRDLPVGAPDGTVVCQGTRSDVALWALEHHDTAGRTFAVVVLPRGGPQ